MLPQVGHPAVEVVQARMRDGSAPGKRRDGFKVGLVVEGGGMRGVVSGAALQAMHDLGLRCVVTATSLAHRHALSSLLGLQLAWSSTCRVHRSYVREAGRKARFPITNHCMARALCCLNICMLGEWYVAKHRISHGAGTPLMLCMEVAREPSMRHTSCPGNGTAWPSTQRR